MVTMSGIEEFLSQRALALAGVSRDGRGFGNVVRRELRARGYDLRLIHPEADAIDGEPCVRSVANVAREVGGLVLVTPPAATERLVREAAAAGIARVWIQQGGESSDALRFCEQNAVDVVHGQCILMYAAPVKGIHAFHRTLCRVFHKLPPVTVSA